MDVKQQLHRGSSPPPIHLHAALDALSRPSSLSRLSLRINGRGAANGGTGSRDDVDSSRKPQATPTPPAPHSCTFSYISRTPSPVAVVAAHRQQECSGLSALLSHTSHPHNPFITWWTWRRRSWTSPRTTISPRVRFVAARKKAAGLLLPVTAVRPLTPSSSSNDRSRLHYGATAAGAGTTPGAWATSWTWTAPA